MYCLHLKISVNNEKWIEIKMDSIVIMDEKCIVFITFKTKLEGYM